jgi:hypothetical protein
MRTRILLSAATSAAFLIAVTGPAAHSQVGGVFPLPTAVPTAVPTVVAVPTVDPALIDAATGAIDPTAVTDQVAQLQQQVDDFLATGALPEDPAALAALTQQLNDLVAQAGGAVDTGALTDALTTLTDSVNKLLAPTGATPVKPTAAIAALGQGGVFALPHRLADGSIAQGKGAGQLLIATRKLVIKRGAAKLRITCALTSAGCAGNVQSYSKVGKLPGKAAQTSFLKPGAGKTLKLRYSKRSVRRLKRDKRVSLLVVSKYASGFGGNLRTVKRVPVRVAKG